jgi:steroid 5-alpha reductase family enzyme/tryptophan-rich sensory protein
MDLFPAFLIAMGIQYLLFIPAYFFQTDKLTDLSYGITFILLTLLAYREGAKATILAIMLLLWAGRLIAYLFTRIHHMKKDKRFDGMRESLPRFLRFWTLQGLAVFVIMLPALLAFRSASTEYSVIGIAIFAFGLIIEAIADHQKFTFKKDKKNKDRWIDTGLWKYSRHPNYLGEMLVWIGIYLFAFPSLGTSERLIGAIGPLFIILLLLFVSGIPLLEKNADRKWGNRKDYREYKRRTPSLIPFQTPLLCIILCLAAGGIGGMFTITGPGTWYASIIKPSFNPPNWVFGPVWTLLYILMGIALALAIRAKARTAAYVAFGVQLLLNTLWSILFFGLSSPVLAFICIILLWGSILATILLFWKQSRLAASLLIPYLLWVSFATVLNGAIMLLN